MNQKAQGTIEYLVIIAIVVVIALVVVGLLLQILGNFGTMSETSVKTSWKSAEPWAITDWSRASGGVLTVVLKNNSSDTLNLRDFNLLSTGGSDRNNTTTTVFNNIAPGATVNVTFVTTGGTSCAGSFKYSYPKAGIAIDYNNGTIAKRQYGVADIVGTC